jgi:tRNA threonylcarbamoyl adenosine modification protein YeaZ
MILVIDTSASMTAHVALVGKGGRGATVASRDHRAITRVAREMIKGQTLIAVAVATGPGSFTGLRVGVAFGLGLAIGLKIPIIPLPSLDLWAARVEEPATAVIDAGRGRVYYRVPGAEPALGSTVDVPASHPLVGNVTPVMESALVAAGHRFLRAGPDSFGRAAAKLLETAHEVPYRNLEITYMQSFSPKGA